MATRERAVDRGTQRGRDLIRMLGREARNARRDRGLSLRAVAAALAVSPATAWRFEHALTRDAGIAFVARLFAVVGLDFSARAFAGPSPIREPAHTRLLNQFGAGLHATLRWATEVPMPQPGDQRRWDGLVSGRGWRYGVEGETGPTDGQALAGRLELKRRDGDVDGVLLVLPATRRVAAFLAAAEPILAPHFPLAGPTAVRLLAAGADPGGSSLIVLRSDGRPAPWAFASFR